MIQVGDFILDAFQERAVEKLRAEFRKGHTRVLCVAPTGAGKTIVSLGIEQLCIENGTRVAFITTGRSLIFQKAAKAAEAGLNFSVLMGDSPYEWDPDADLLIISKDTLEARYGTISWREPRLFIVDECDIATSENWMNILQRAEMTLGLTATPITSQGQPLPWYEAVVDVASYSELIHSGRLVDVPVGNLYSPYRPSLTGGKLSGGDWNLRWLEKRMNNKRLVGDIVTHWQRHGQDRPTVVFCINKAHTAAVCEAFNGAGIRAEYIVDDTPQADRQVIFDATARGDNKVIVNCATLTRGWDLPCVSCCVLARPSKSLRLILQMLGRVLRAAPGKKDAIVIDHSGAVMDIVGWPTEDRIWSIDPDADLADLQEQQRKEKKGDQPEKSCPSCHVLLPGRYKVCPNCGYAKLLRGQLAETEDGELVAVKKKPKKKGERTESDDLKRQWSGLLFSFGRSGLRYGNAASAFHQKTGKWPEQAGVPWTASKSDAQTKISVLFPWVLGRAKKGR